VVQFLLAQKWVLGSFPLMYLGKHLQLNQMMADEWCLLCKMELIWVAVKHYDCAVLSHSSEILLDELSVGHSKHFAQC
jgi:hypothetical protein